MEPAHSSFFEDAIHVTPIDSHTYAAFLKKDWCIGVVPHGGYTASILYRTTAVHFATTHSARYRGSTPEATTLQVTFLDRTSVGPAMLQVQDVKIGGRHSTIHVTLSQLPDSLLAKVAKGAKPDLAEFTRSNLDQLQPKQVAYITASPPETESGPSATGAWSLHPPPPPGSKPDGAVDLPALARNSRDAGWEQYSFPGILRAIQQVTMFGPGPQYPASVEERARRGVNQWTRFSPGPSGKVARWTNESVMFLMDTFPVASDRMCAMQLLQLRQLGRPRDPAEEALSFEKLFWYPTLTMTIDLKTRIPAEGVEWLYTRVNTKMLRGGRADLEVVALNEQGEPVALGAQTALVVDAARNFARRPSIEKL
ncbi:thioesterase-like superfamily-domain-containing protein [Aspergillus pseudodeflectus]|uniref:Thioesterase-like superfamily-domain-containing protein n=1 Tax=Aspergillus pseudodeflectus TaxID=176178 RepID=A0ABR4JH69_9EURO